VKKGVGTRKRHCDNGRVLFGVRSHVLFLVPDAKLEGSATTSNGIEKETRVGNGEEIKEKRGKRPVDRGMRIKGDLHSEGVHIQNCDRLKLIRSNNPNRGKYMLSVQARD